MKLQRPSVSSVSALPNSCLSGFISAPAFDQLPDAPVVEIKVGEGAPPFGEQMDEIYAVHAKQGVPFVRVRFVSTLDVVRFTYRRLNCLKK
jgi:hypothetical protein